MEFGVPSKQRNVKVEKYPNTPVLTLLPYEGGNTARKIEFNKKAQEMLEFIEDDTNEVAFSFNRSNFSENAIVNVNGLNLDAALNVAKNGRLSNKQHYKEIKDRYKVPMEDELELTIIATENKYNDKTVFNLVTLKSAQLATTEELENKDEELVGSNEEAHTDAIHDDIDDVRENHIDLLTSDESEVVPVKPAQESTDANSASDDELPSITDSMSDYNEESEDDYPL